MPIKRLSITNLRNIQHIDFEPHPSLNLFYGANGAGKTSILEAINLASLGRSFRHRGAKPLLRDHCTDLTVFAQVGDRRQPDHRLGISKDSRGNTDIHIDGAPVYTAARLAELLPILNLNAQSFELINGPPKPRRQLLDWLTFHVEPLFLPAWKQLQNCVKQRNSLLRRGKIRPAELESWDSQLTDLAEKIHSFRQSAFGLYTDALSSLGDLVPDAGLIALKYKKGWPLDTSFADALAQHRSSDAQRGFTQVGPHRADLAITVDRHNAAETLSRGQSKVVIAGLMVALAKAYSRQSGRTCSLLVDDLPSELDEVHRQRVGQWLGDLGAQLFVTAVESGPLVGMWAQGLVAHTHTHSRLFHVKHGGIEIC